MEDLTGDCQTYSEHTAGLLAFGWVLYFIVLVGTASIMYESALLDTALLVKICLALSSLAWFFYLCGWAQYAAKVPDACNFDTFSAHKGPSFSFTVLSWLVLTGLDSLAHASKRPIGLIARYLRLAGLPCMIYRIGATQAGGEADEGPPAGLGLTDEAASPVGGGAATQDESAKA